MSCMHVWCDLHVARNVLCTAISCAVVINTRDFTKTLGTSHKTHACTALASVKFKSSCTVLEDAMTKVMKTMTDGLRNKTKCSWNLKKKDLNLKNNKDVKSENFS